jgi:hypothetical protein
MAFLQDLYPDDYSHCHGCGRLNPHGLHIKSEWRDGETVAHFMPGEYHIALPGYVYGGLIASLVDCHSIAAGAAAAMHAAGELPGRDETPRFVTGPLRRLPADPDGPSWCCGRAEEVGAQGDRRLSVMAGDVEVARGR